MNRITYQKIPVRKEVSEIMERYSKQLKEKSRFGKVSSDIAYGTYNDCCNGICDLFENSSKIAGIVDDNSSFKKGIFGGIRTNSVIKRMRKALSSMLKEINNRTSFNVAYSLSKETLANGQPLCTKDAINTFVQEYPRHSCTIMNLVIEDLMKKKNEAVSVDSKGIKNIIRCNEVWLSHGC